MENDDKLMLWLVLVTFLALAVAIAFAIWEKQELVETAVQATPL